MSPSSASRITKTRVQDARCFSSHRKLAMLFADPMRAQARCFFWRFLPQAGLCIDEDFVLPYLAREEQLRTPDVITD